MYWPLNFASWVLLQFCKAALLVMFACFCVAAVAQKLTMQVARPKLGVPH